MLSIEIAFRSIIHNVIGVGCMWNFEEHHAFTYHMKETSLLCWCWCCREDEEDNTKNLLQVEQEDAETEWLVD